MKPTSRRTLYVSDLDGTLLNPQGYLSPFAQNALKVLNHEKIAFTLASGRAYSSIRRALQDSHITLPIISSDGGLISPWDKPTPLWIKPMNPQIAREIVDMGLERGLTVLLDLWDGHENYLIPLGPVFHEGWKIYLEWKKVESHFQIRPVAGTSSFDQKTSQTQIISLTFMDRQEKIQGLHLALRGREAHIKVDTQNWTSYSQWDFLWIQDPGATKETALGEWEKLHPGQYDQVVVFGDEFNDVGMFGLGHHGVAVSNAIPQVQELAREVIGPSWEDSVMKYILQKEGLRLQ